MATIMLELVVKVCITYAMKKRLVLNWPSLFLQLKKAFQRRRFDVSFRNSIDLDQKKNNKLNCQ